VIVSCEPVDEEALPPLAHGHGIDAEPGGHVGVVQALGASQDDPGAKGEPLSALGPGGPGLQLLSLVIAQDEWSFRTTAFAHRKSPLENYMMNTAISQGSLAIF